MSIFKSSVFTLPTVQDDCDHSFHWKTPIHDNAIFVYVMAGQGLIGINQSEASNLHPAILHKFC